MELDLEKEVMDIEGLLDAIEDMLYDIGSSIKASVKGRLKLIKSHSVLLKRNQNRIRELITRYDLDKVKTIAVGGSLYDFFIDDIPMSTEIDIIEKTMQLSIDDFNLAPLDILTSIKQDKTFHSLMSKSEYFDTVCKNLLISGYFDEEDSFVNDVKSGKLHFVSSYIFGNSFKGIVIDVEKQLCYSKVLRFNRKPTMPKIIPVSLFTNTLENFIAFNDNDIRTIIGVYKRTIKDTSKYLRILKNKDGLTVGNTRIITDSLVKHIDNIADSIFKKTDMQYDFLVHCLKSLDSYVVSGTSRMSL